MPLKTVSAADELAGPAEHNPGTDRKSQTPKKPPAKKFDIV
jgi:hypothetical protein